MSFTTELLTVSYQRELSLRSFKLMTESGMMHGVFSLFFNQLHTIRLNTINVCCLLLKIEFYSCARGHKWSSIFISIDEQIR